MLYLVWNQGHPSFYPYQYKQTGGATLVYWPGSHYTANF